MGTAVDNFRLNLRAELDRTGISPRALSLRAGLGPDAVRDIYRKSGGFTLATAEAIAGALGKSLVEMTADPGDEFLDPEILRAVRRIPSEKKLLAVSLLNALRESA
jgi:lambda repressor-like predicted transcriptional regulator